MWPVSVSSGGHLPVCFCPYLVRQELIITNLHRCSSQLPSIAIKDGNKLGIDKQPKLRILFDKKLLEQFSVLPLPILFEQQLSPSHTCSSLFASKHRNGASTWVRMQKVWVVSPYLISGCRTTVSISFDGVQKRLWIGIFPSAAPAHIPSSRGRF